jgi:hypothetical protein
LARNASPKADPAATVVTLKITLKGLKPPVWRRLAVPGGIKLDRLSSVILATMGWRGGHLHSFGVDGRDYGDPGSLDDVADERKLTLGGIAASGVKNFEYTYDFGDSWEHQIVIEGSRPAAPGETRPVCVAGKRSCPPEDCGGVWGYMELLEILADPNHPERAERLEWLGEEEFDPERFDIETLNARLAARR